MKKLVTLLMAVVSVLMVAAACGNGETASNLSADDGRKVAVREVVKEVPIEVAVMVEREVIQEVGGFAPAPGASSVALETVGRKIISTGSLSIEVESVDTAVSEVRHIAEDLGGFLQHISSSGGRDRQHANLTIRVPQAAFFTAIDRIETLGVVESRSVGSDDVSEQFIDLEARLKSALREEESLLSLLERATTVSEILTIERELSRVRSEIERLQGQLSFLERRVELATISLSLFSPGESTVPPTASLAIEVSDVTDSVDEVKKLIGRKEGELDQVVLSIRKDAERADISLRVFTPDFRDVLATIERQGKLLSKELEEGTTPTDEDAARAGDPEARINLTFVTGEGPNWGLISAIVAPIGGVLLAALLGLLFYLTYRVGRRRGAGA